MMQEANRISVTLRGKNYTITTRHSQETVSIAAEKLESAIDTISASAPSMREDQMLLFAALLASSECLSVSKSDSSADQDAIKGMNAKVCELNTILDQALSVSAMQ